ncbi:hypothetical protein IC582_026175 [Cucumis melo]
MGRLFVVEKDASVRTKILCSICETFIASYRNMDFRHLYVNSSDECTGIYFSSAVNLVENASQRIEDNDEEDDDGHPYGLRTFPPIPCIFPRKVLIAV